MAPKIIPFESGINSSYLIREEGVVMYDAAPFKDPSVFSGLLEMHRLKPGDIRLIVLSHGDFDHVGGAKKLKELTGAKIAIHEKDQKNLEEAIFHWPEGVTAWGRLSRFIFKPLVSKIGSFELQAVEADIALGDQSFSLEEYGISGRVIHTPGHTYGSVSILLDSGDALVGCLAHNRMPFVMKPGLPIYAMDLELLKKSWRVIIDQGAKYIYPSHGKPFPVEKMLRYLK